MEEAGTAKPATPNDIYPLAEVVAWPIRLRVASRNQNAAQRLPQCASCQEGHLNQAS